MTLWILRPMWLSSGSNSCLTVSSSMATTPLEGSLSVVELVRPRYCPWLFSGSSVSGAMRKANPSPGSEWLTRKMLIRKELLKEATFSPPTPPSSQRDEGPIEQYAAGPVRKSEVAIDGIRSNLKGTVADCGGLFYFKDAIVSFVEWTKFSVEYLRVLSLREGKNKERNGDSNTRLKIHENGLATASSLLAIAQGNKIICIFS
ncbi:hypothetical protein OIU85_002809 [Salix viminalis]|uniref:Uncharacterized protein n=1 Tax=Salix viminalis TaxID=40686 RepID=A0A9Q0ZZ82_SALVM|nr:hypothetical protein OIU85_002809 [Salix viminalis]